MKSQLFILFLISNACTMFSESDVQAKTPVTPEELQFYKCAVLFSLDMEIKLSGTSTDTPTDEKRYDRLKRFLNQQFAINKCFDPRYQELHDHHVTGLELQRKIATLANKLEETSQQPNKLHDDVPACPEAELSKTQCQLELEKTKQQLIKLHDYVLTLSQEKINSAQSQLIDEFNKFD